MKYYKLLITRTQYSMVYVAINNKDSIDLMVNSFPHLIFPKVKKQIEEDCIWEDYEDAFKIDHVEEITEISEMKEADFIGSRG